MPSAFASLTTSFLVLFLFLDGARIFGVLGHIPATQRTEGRDVEKPRVDAVFVKAMAPGAGQHAKLFIGFKVAHADGTGLNMIHIVRIISGFARRVCCRCCCYC